MQPNIAAAIVALRPALEALVVRAAKEPDTITQLSPQDEKVMNVIKELCRLNAGKFGQEQVTGGLG